jgi:hypothetical protein
MHRYFTDLADAFVRGRLGRPEATIEDGINAGLRLHKFKSNAELPRVQRVLGILRGLAPDSLLDIGSGRGTFLWPLLAAFPQLPVTSAPEVPIRPQPVSLLSDPKPRPWIFGSRDHQIRGNRHIWTSRLGEGYVDRTACFGGSPNLVGHNS